MQARAGVSIRRIACASTRPAEWAMVSLVNLLRDLVVPQLARPHGLVGGLFAALLNRGNRLITAHTIGALDLEPGEDVLEVGFGGGVGLDLAQVHEASARLTGVDVSGAMVRRARRRFPGLALHEASVEAMPLAEASFDAAFAVNAAYFWPDLGAALGELRRVLRPGARLALGVRPAAACTRLEFERSGHRVWDPEGYVGALADAGFERARARRLPDDDGGAYVILGRAPA